MHAKCAEFAAFLILLLFLAVAEQQTMKAKVQEIGCSSVKN